MMKFTLAWLKEHLETDRPLGDIADKLTMIGLEVERIEDKGKALAPFVIARVVEAKQHPNADRLRVCMVDTGDGKPIQVVCGAPNARTGMTGVFVPPGAYIPGKDMTLSVGTIRGVESRGMLVSEFELKISDNHEGIIDLPGRCAGRRQLRAVGRPRRSGDRDQPDAEPVRLHRRARHRARPCRRRHGQVQGCGDQADQRRVPLPGRGEDRLARTLPGLWRCAWCAASKNGPSPQWLQKRLIAIGLRPINALVDITNFITYDRGRPLHVFDAAKVRGQSDGAPRASRRDAAGARRQDLQTRRQCLRHRRRGRRRIALPASWAAKKPVARMTTTDVLIESALWDSAQHRADRPQARHQFRRQLPLRARRRSGFHAAGPRTCDPNGARALRRHAIRDHGGGQRARGRTRHRLSALRDQTARRPRLSRCRKCAACSNGSAFLPPARASG